MSEGCTNAEIHQLMNETVDRIMAAWQLKDAGQGIPDREWAIIAAKILWGDGARWLNSIQPKERT